MLATAHGEFDAESLVVATGGLSIPAIGATPWGYRLAAVAKEGDLTVLQTQDEPGFSVKDGRIKQLFFPCWGFSGTATWRIPGFALARPDERGGRSLVQSRDAKFTPKTQGK